MSTTSLCPSTTREQGPGAKRVLPLLFLTCLLDAAGVGLIVPLLPTLIGGALETNRPRLLKRLAGPAVAPTAPGKAKA